MTCTTEFSVDKDPNATLDYSIDWSKWLEVSGNDTLSASTWILPSDLTVVSQSFSANKTFIWLSGGQIGRQYSVTNRITTNSTPPRIDDRSFVIFIKEK